MLRRKKYAKKGTTEPRSQVLTKGLTPGLIPQCETIHLRRSPKRAHEAGRNFASSPATFEPSGQNPFTMMLYELTASQRAHQALLASKCNDAARKVVYAR